jgi:predicted AlkP superfamily pyrophosphatase or phosphodiesterase
MCGNTVGIAQPAHLSPHPVTRLLTFHENWPAHHWLARRACDNLVQLTSGECPAMKKVRALCSIFVLLLFLSSQSPAADKKPKLLVALVVDQFRYDYTTRFRPDYHAGLARLLEHGAVFTAARYVHFPTVTAIGHSTFMSGATPSVSGIIGNEWFDRAANHAITSVSDETTLLLGGVPKAKGSSPDRLLVSTVGDELKMAGRSRKVIGISIKDRSAILPSGHMADAAYWFDNDSNHFVSSTYYMKELPQWVAKVNQEGPILKYLGATWRALDARPGDKPFCSMAAGSELRYCGGLEATPFGNELLEDFAEKAIQNEALGTHEGTDVLALSLSSNDYVGHALGPDSPEVRDMSLRTDQLIGKLLDFIDSKIGAGNTLVVFTADHGVAPVPEVNQARKMPGGRLDSAVMSQTIGNVLSTRFGKGDWFLADGYGFFYLNYDTAKKNNADLADVRRLAVEIARGLPHIARAYSSDELLRGQSAALDDFEGRAVQAGFYGPRSADLVVVPEPYYMFYPQGTTHAAPFSYDTHVPLIFYGAGIRPGIHYESVAINDVAPTLAAIFEVETPSGSSGKILWTIFQ